MGDRLRFRHYLTLYGLYARMDLDWVLRDTRLALLAVLADLLANISSISGIFLLAWRFDGVGNMGKYEVLLMLGYITCINGLYQMFFSANNGHISRRIGRGQFDHMMMQPLPYGVQVMTEGFIPFTGCQNLLAGIGIVLFSVSKLGISPNIWWWFGLLGYLLISIALILGLSYLFSSLAFWRPIAFEEISTTVIDDLAGQLSNYPLSGMPSGIQWMLLTVLPSGLLGWFPVCALLGKAPFALSSLYPLLVTGTIWLLAALAFRKGIKHYVTIGSNRYKSGGHRR